MDLGIYTLYENGILFFMCICTSCTIWYLWHLRRLPPGPYGLPVVGCWPMIKTDPHLKFREWSQEYGDVFCLYVGQKLVVVLSSYEAIKDTLIKKGADFADRPASFFTKNITKGHGVIWGNGENWRQQRKFALNSLRYHDKTSDTSLEDILNVEIDDLVLDILNQGEEPFDLHPLFSFTIGNVISSVLFGRRFARDDSEFREILHLMSGWVTKYNFISNPLNFWPWLRYFPGFHTQEATKNIEVILGFFEREVDKHMQDQHHMSGDFVYSYLQEIKKNDKTKSFSKEQLLIVIRDLFVAAIETTEATLSWGILFMVLHQDVQSKVQLEIRNNKDSKKRISWADRSKFPYTCATIWEIQRCANIDPFSVPRCTAVDTQYRGYFIPKGTSVYPNFWAINLSEKFFHDAHLFNPRRHLNEAGQLERQNPYLPFGQGKRFCIGDFLAKMELFLTFTTLLQNFTFKADIDNPPTANGIFGVVHTPENFNVVALKDWTS